MSLACTVTAIISLIAPAMDLVWSSANGRSPGFFSEEIIWHQLSRATDEDRNGLASNLNSSLANYQKKTDESRDRCSDGRVDDRKLLTQRRVSELIADAVRFSKKKKKPKAFWYPAAPLMNLSGRQTSTPPENQHLREAEPGDDALNGNSP